jgi:putative intracellular protease/amidase
MHTMKARLVGLAALALILAAGQSIGAESRSKGRVLMIVRPGDQEVADLMLTREVGVMKSTLKEAGYSVVIATITGQPVKGSTASLAPDLKVSDAKVTDYKGLILPCMAAGNSAVPLEAVEIVKKAFGLGMPIAAQNSAARILGQSGVLKGRRFAIEADLVSTVAGGTYSGFGVVQDGTIVTSGTCPLMAQELKRPDGTLELTKKLIALMQ